MNLLNNEVNKTQGQIIVYVSDAANVIQESTVLGNVSKESSKITFACDGSGNMKYTSSPVYLFDKDKHIKKNGQISIYKACVVASVDIVTSAALQEVNWKQQVTTINHGNKGKWMFCKKM